MPPSDTIPQPETSLDTIQKNLAKRFKTDETLVRIRSGEGLVGSEPLILIHDGSGISVKFQKIKPLDRELWGIANPKTFTNDTWEDLNAMASTYAAKIATTMVGPYILGGWSFGGVVAFRAAQILLADKHPVRGVILIDSPPPLDHQPLPADLIDIVFKTSQKPNKIVDTIHRSIRRQVILNTALLTSFRPVHGTPTPKMILLRSREGYDTSSLPCRHTAWLSDRSDPRCLIDDWETVVGAKVDVMDIPGHHFGPFEADNIEDVSNAVKRACEML